MRLRTILMMAIGALPAVAAAHITFAEPRAEAGSYYAGFLRVSHGCGASPTVSIRVEIPTGIDVARPQPKAGWMLAIDHGPLAKPIRSESGTVVTNRVTAVTWTGNLPADEFDQFGIMLKLPQQSGPLFFPTTQNCAVGANAWVNTPATPGAWHSTTMPAPMLIVTGSVAQAPADHMDMDHMDMNHQ